MEYRDWCSSESNSLIFSEVKKLKVMYLSVFWDINCTMFMVQGEAVLGSYCLGV